MNKEMGMTVRKSGRTSGARYNKGYNKRCAGRYSDYNNYYSSEETMIGLAKKVALLLTIPAVIFIALMLFKTDASGQDDVLESKRAFYHEMEGIYREALDNVLESKGIYDAGVTITSIIDIKGDRVYTVSIYHTKLTRMDEEERVQFLEDMSHLSFTDGVTPIKYEIFM